MYQMQNKCQWITFRLTVPQTVPEGGYWVLSHSTKHSTTIKEREKKKNRWHIWRKINKWKTHVSSIILTLEILEKEINEKQKYWVKTERISYCLKTTVYSKRCWCHCCKKQWWDGHINATQNCTKARQKKMTPTMRQLISLASQYSQQS